MHPARKGKPEKQKLATPKGAEGAEARRGFVSCENEPGTAGMPGKEKRSDFDHIRVVE